MTLEEHSSFTKVCFRDESTAPLYCSKRIRPLVCFLNDVAAGRSRGTLNIICAETGCGKTAIMSGFSKELLAQGKSCKSITAQQLITDLLLAISQDSAEAFLHQTDDILILDDCFILYDSTAKIVEKMHMASPVTTMFLLFDEDIPFVQKQIMPYLSVDQVFELPHLNKAARTAFVMDYLQANPQLKVTEQQALQHADSIKQIAALRAAIQREHLKGSV